MRAARLLSLVLLLQNRGRLTADELARELGVSTRTVYRDIDSLSSAGIPVYGDAGHRGGYQLLDGYRTRLTGLHADEAESLFLAGMPGAADDLGLGEVLAAAQLKLDGGAPGAPARPGRPDPRALPPRRRRLVPGTGLPAGSRGPRRGRVEPAADPGALPPLGRAAGGRA
ncbi:helix-turn-helix transcriptional regulator [Streptomyces adustus]